MNKDSIQKLSQSIAPGKLNDFIEAMTDIYGGEVTMEVARQIIHNEEHKVTPNKVLKYAGHSFSVDPLDIIGLTRRRTISDARKASMFMCMQFGLFKTLTDCGHFFNRDHATVLHAKRSHLQLFETDAAYRHQVNNTLELLKG